MEKLTRKEVENTCEHLKTCLIQTIELDEQMQEIKLLQTKAHYNLSMARDDVRNLRLQ